MRPHILSLHPKAILERPPTPQAGAGPQDEGPGVCLLCAPLLGP